MNRPIHFTMAAVLLATCWMAGCQKPARVIDPLPDPPMGAMLRDVPSPVQYVFHSPPVSDQQPRPHHTQVTPPPTPPTPPPTTKRFRVVLDPGHGGRDPGAISVIGMFEKYINLVVATEAARLLKQRGVDVWLTRGTDIYLTLEQRAAMGNRLKAHLFVSVHADSAVSRTAKGFTVYVARRSSRQSRAAAGAIVASMKSTALSSRGVRKANYRVLVKTRGPAVLVELGYLSNRVEAAKLSKPQFQKTLAKAVAKGICNYLGVRWRRRR